MIEKTRPNARVSFSGYTATHTTDEKRSDSSQKNALKLTSSLFVVGVLVHCTTTNYSPKDKNDDSDGVSGNGDHKES